MSKIFTTIFALAAFAGTTMAADAGPDAPKPKPYTLSTCIVSGDKLGEMGSPVVVTREGREIKFCCKGCVKDFDKDSAKFIKKIDEAEAKAKDAAKPAADSDHSAHQH